MTQIETLIREVAERGGLAALTIWQIPDGTYQANVTKDRVAWRVEYDRYPAIALAKVLSAPATAPTYAAVGLAPLPAPPAPTPSTEEDLFG